MKKCILLLVVLILISQGLFAQGNYVPIPRENYATFYGDCNIDVRLPTNAPWYVFSDRENNPLYSNESGPTEVARLELGASFLVIGNSPGRLKVVEANKVIYNMANGTWQFRAGSNNSNVVQGWIPRDNLLLNQKCLKVCNVGIPSAPTGMFNLQGLYVYNVATTNTDYKYFSHVPGTFRAGVGRTELYDGDRFGYIYKVMRLGSQDWYLIGLTDEIKIGDRRIVLKGWKPQNQIELWKHRLAMEYNWEGTPLRASTATNVRLKVLKNIHNSEISLSNYSNSSTEFVDIESNGSECLSLNNFYFTRDKGEVFRHVLLSENRENYRVGVLKNTSNEDKRVIACARHIANDILKKLYKPKVIFVLDGTQSLTPEIPNILRTITSTCDNITRNNLGTAISYEYAASIYRDERYLNKFEYMNSFSPNIGTVTNWITTNLPHSQGNDCDQAEAVFYGLNRTIDYFEGLPLSQKSFFNPTFYVLIGDAGSKNPDIDGVTDVMIKNKLRSNVSDLVAIQFSHALDRSNCNAARDNGVSFDLFRSQFSNILSIYGEGEEGAILGGSKVTFPLRPGSFLAYPVRGNSFGANDLSLVIKESLENYNSTIQEKIINVAAILRNSSSGKAIDELKVLIRDQNCVVGEECMLRVMEWVIRFIENAAKEINSDVEISTSDANFFNLGYVSPHYDFINHTPFKNVIYMNSNNLDKLIEFSGKISKLQGGAIRPQIQQIWQYMLITSLGIYQTPNQVNALTISEATSLLTGFKTNNVYDNIHIGEITSAGLFPNDLLFKYVFEWAITNRYLQSVKNGSWELTRQNLIPLQPIMNAIKHNNGQPNITLPQIDAFSARLERRDNRSLGNYFNGYPQEDLDPLYKLKAYWIEADFFSTRENDFVNMLLR